MFSSARRWLRRNRTPIAIGLGVVGAGYVVTQYVLSKINDARERMSSERIAKENLRRRFEQNQEDCTFTVLALLPTAMTNILETMNTENITYEIQQMKGSGKAPKAVGSLSPPSASETNATDDDGRSMVSMQSESGVHASQMSLPSPSAAAGGGADAPQDGGQAGQKNRKTKRQLWDDLTISSITRAYTLVYVLGLLTMLTRVQLNLLGRRAYLSSVVSLATSTNQATISLENNDEDNPEQTYGNDFQINRRYLTFSWWLLNRGWVDIMRRVETAVRLVFGHLSPRDLLTFETFASLTSQTRKLVEGGSTDGQPATQWLPFLLPTPDLEEFVLRESGILDDPTQPPPQEAPQAGPPSPDTSARALRRLLDETADLIESPAFSHVLVLLLDAGFSALVDKKVAVDAFELPARPSAAHAPGGSQAPDPSGSQPQPPPQPSKAALLPKILSVLTRQAHAIGHGMPNEYLQEMEGVRDLEGFAAVVYSSNWESEIQAPEDEAPAEADTRPGADARLSQASGVSGPGVGGESVVVVDKGDFESAWERAVEQSRSR